MLLTLLLQLVIALVTTFARSHDPDGRPGTSLALGFLVPMLGFGLNGLWAAFHGDFPKRRDVEGVPAGGDVEDLQPGGDVGDRSGS